MGPDQVMTYKEQGLEEPVRYDWIHVIRLNFARTTPYSHITFLYIIISLQSVTLDKIKLIQKK